MRAALEEAAAAIGAVDARVLACHLLGASRAWLIANPMHVLTESQDAQYESLVQADAIVVLRGSIDKRPGSTEANFIVNEVIRLEDLPARYTRGVLIRVQEDRHGANKLPLLREILRGYPGPTVLQLLLCLADGHRITCKCSDAAVAINPELRHRIDELLGPGNFRLLTAPPNTGARGGNGNGWGR